MAFCHSWFNEVDSLIKEFQITWSSKDHRLIAMRNREILSLLVWCYFCWRCWHLAGVWGWSCAVFEILHLTQYYFKKTWYILVGLYITCSLFWSLVLFLFLHIIVQRNLGNENFVSNINPLKVCWVHWECLD